MSRGDNRAFTRMIHQQNQPQPPQEVTVKIEMQDNLVDFIQVEIEERLKFNTGAA